MKKPLALLDLDNTLADYHGAMLRDMMALMGPHELNVLDGFPLDIGAANKIPHLKKRMDLISSVPGWWLGLEPLANGFHIVEALKRAGFRFHILTRGPKRKPLAWAEKVSWGLQHLPGTPITITHDKSKFYGNVLVDDWPEYVEPWLKHRPRGLVIMPDQPWNTGFEHPQVIRYSGGKDMTVLEARVEEFVEGLAR